MADFDDAAPGEIFTGAVETPAQGAALDFQRMANEASAAFFEMMRNRHEEGEKEYGPVKFMEVNTLIEAMEEVVDMANYAMYSFIKLWILNAQMQRLVGQTPEMIGPNSFMKAGS